MGKSCQLDRAAGGSLGKHSQEPALVQWLALGYVQCATYPVLRPVSSFGLLEQKVVTPLAAIVYDRVHHGTDVAVNDTILGLVVFLVGGEGRMIAHAITDLEIVVHFPSIVVDDTLFFACRCPYHQGVLSVTCRVIIIIVFCFIFVEFFCYNAFPYGLFHVFYAYQIDDQHQETQPHADDDRFITGQIIDKETRNQKADREQQDQSPHAANGALFVLFCRS